MQTGPGRAVTLDFDYRRPPAPGRPSRRAYLARRVVDRLYFRLIRR